MRLVSWNINGIRRPAAGVGRVLEALGADVVCLQETRVTRDLLDEPTAIVEGYNSYFSFSRGRSGYSGVATFCKDSATPVAAEEGLSGLLADNRGAIGCYGDTEGFTEDELRALDSEGRAVITQHRIRTSDKREKTLTVINVYCPHADPEKPERKTFKLRFYHLLKLRAEAILRAGSHVIILGDVNTSHRPIDHCDPSDPEHFDENPGRRWLNEFLWEPGKAPGKGEVADPPPGGGGGAFVDSFRYFHPTQTNAFTCWSVPQGARHTNYGTRIDYILGDRILVTEEFEDSVLLPEVEGSDHCPVRAVLKSTLMAAPKCPPFCTKYLPEFAGKQQKLSQFLVRLDRRGGSRSSPPDSPESAEAVEDVAPPNRQEKRNSAEKTKVGVKKNRTSASRGGGTLLRFFKPGDNREGKANPPEKMGPDRAVQDQQAVIGVPQAAEQAKREGETAPAEPKEGQAAFWKSVFKGPPPPPPCKVHGEPCVMRTVKKAGPNHGRQFYVCARPVGHATNPAARCDFFLWVPKKQAAPR
ncbi:DNA-(apurinic or apyrimidinic site) endonuclease 2 isoform X1 [Ornithorhynchus anatinus]|uniref:DNA-(apurinic or apyrimidinic site) endonuclease 2 isoform X1 n=1 Tax=Ornithorhynchus anatinus TaxID=9258 RepID=UPI0010A87653|nr:DNA-(apurinic or apyrimidinic site) endonuclease 2 isoform X1 [Ornithorhynchus anatinus]